jgi:predicted anti-sigma-YlaC factor YlaD
MSLSLDGEISTLEAAALARHLGRCAGCAAQSEVVAALTAVLRASPPEPMRLPFVPPVQRPPLGRRRAALAFATLAAVAAAAGVVVLGSPVILPGSPVTLPGSPVTLQDSSATLQGASVALAWEAAARARAADSVPARIVPHIAVNVLPSIPPSPYWARARAAST